MISELPLVTKHDHRVRTIESSPLLDPSPAIAMRLEVGLNDMARILLHSWQLLVALAIGVMDWRLREGGGGPLITPGDRGTGIGIR